MMLTFTSSIVWADGLPDGYYLVGTFNMNGNNWVQDVNYKFTESNGIYELNGVNLPDETEFKIIKVQSGTPNGLVAMEVALIMASTAVTTQTLI